jgi:small subunit ribosomal protein S11
MARKARGGVQQKKERKNIAAGVAHIHASFNNTIVTITDVNGNTISWASGGSVGFKGTKKGTPFAAQVAAEPRGTRRDGTRHAQSRCAGQRSRTRTRDRHPPLQAAGLEIQSIKDVTPVPHNGCRPPKRRRV